jgi:DNA-binding Lrp family transcriptional regulator
MTANALITIPELADAIGITERSIERTIKKLQEEGRLRRIGPAKGGHWEVVS